MTGLVRRDGMWIYRRRVPAKLRTVIGTREVKRSLGTSDLNKAQTLWRAVNAEVDRMFAEAAAGQKSPSVAAYRAVERSDRRQRR